MLEIAGLMISGVSLLSELWGRFKDLSAWTEADLLVDGDYLGLAIAAGHVEGAETDFLWSREEKVPSRELRGAHSVVIAFNAEKKIKYRITQGRAGDRLILMRRVPPGTREP